MRQVLFTIPKFEFSIYIILILIEILILAIIYFLFKKKKEILSYLLFFILITTGIYIFAPVPIRTYGVCVGLGFLLAVYVAIILAKKNKIEPGRESQIITDLSFYVLIGIIIGARLFYFLFYDIEYFLTNPLKFFAVWEGGMVFYGGLIGGIITGFIFLKKKRVNILKIADIIGVVLHLGMFIGRWGCFGYGCCFGKVCSQNFPFKVRFPAKGYYGFTPAFEEQLSKGLVSENDKFSLPVYPTQLFESIGCLIIFFILLYLYKRKKFDGQIAAFSIIFYAVLRFIIEFFRVNPSFLGLTVSQWISLGLIIFGAFIYNKASNKNE